MGDVLVTAEYACAKVPEYDSSGWSRCSEDFKFICSSPAVANQTPFASITMEVLKKNILQKVLIWIIMDLL